MKFSYVRMLIAGGWCLSLVTPVTASTAYSPDQCHQIAEDIVMGKRAPLTAQEMMELDSATAQQLTADLVAARRNHQQERMNVAPSNQAADSPDRLPSPAPEQYPANPPVERQDMVNNDQPQTDDEEPLKPLSKKQEAFIKSIAKDAREVAAVHDLYASVMIAQAILESDFGQSDLAREHHNLFGIKRTFQGMGATMPTSECVDGQEIKIPATFRHYPNNLESLTDYAELLDQPMYAQTHRSFCHDYKDATSHLSGSYATDPNYHHKLNRLIETYDLTKYDQPTHLNGKQKPGSKKPDRHSKVTDNFGNVEHNENQNSPSSSHQKKKGVVIPLLSGVGSMSVVELIRRYLK